ncbi:hypothetical protein BDV06DRAFT_215107 [Aspergillus oleicola]
MPSPSTLPTSTFLHHGDPPPTHRINLSLPPSSRYAALARQYKSQLLSITSLFDDLVLSFLPPSFLPKIKWLARRFLRGVYDDEENAEVKGIADVTGVETYLVVALNVLLDLLMGCTSGAALSSPSPSPFSSSHSRGEEDEVGTCMLHFRTLDWAMPALRALLVNLEFVADDRPDSPILATSITYVGFVGVLTGVRRGLSVSLNFRPNHDASSWVKQARFYGGHVAVLLGLRRSISSVLRGVVIPRSRPSRGRTYSLSLSQTVSRITQTPTTACYIILSDGFQTTVLEKDRNTTKTYSSNSFIVATNSDRDAEAGILHPAVATEQDSSMSTSTSSRQEHTGALMTVGERVSIADFIEDSAERRACMQARWDAKLAETNRDAERRRRNAQTRRDPLGRTRSSRRREEAQGYSPAAAIHTAASSSSSLAPSPSAISPEDSAPEPITVTATPEEIISWTTTYPTTNEMTHFAAVMDPVRGRVLWARRYAEPLDCEGLE